mmetsp:Transcript_26291/g.25459  ORF Transcript_26291/g.25459 Transcript_26291/m.25459 type:complete len:109 (+) Transcript_26291:25-351(+)
MRILNLTNEREKDFRTDPIIILVGEEPMKVKQTASTATVIIQSFNWSFLGLSLIFLFIQTAVMATVSSFSFTFAAIITIFQLFIPFWNFSFLISDQDTKAQIIQFNFW